MLYKLRYNAKKKKKELLKDFFFHRELFSIHFTNILKLSFFPFFIYSQLPHFGSQRR